MQHSIHFKALDFTLKFEESDFTDEVNTYFYEYGVRQSLADSYASAKSGAERRALFDKRLTQLQNGELRATRDGDPLSVQITSIARIAANAHFKKLGVKATAIEPKAWAAKMAELRANPKVIAAAEAAVAALGDLEV